VAEALDEAVDRRSAARNFSLGPSSPCKIQAEVGGQTSPSSSTAFAETMRAARSRLQGEVKALTAEGKGIGRKCS